MKIINMNIKLLSLTFCVVSFILHAQDYKLVWSDEFSNSISKDWVFESGHGSNGWGNNELQYYQKENARIENGQLVITAKKEDVSDASYTSVRMKTQGKKTWRYGKIEARIKMPAFQGVWPAFWMLGDNIGNVGWPNCGEIDVMEHVNTEQRTYGTVHYTDGNQSYKHVGGNKEIDVTQYHTYTIDWDENRILWFVDNVQYHEFNIANNVDGTHEFHKPFFILLNMAIGGNWPGFSIDDSAFEAEMYVDYVRVYQKEEDVAVENPTSSNLFEAEAYTAMSGVQKETTSDIDGGQNVGFIDTGDWMSYSNIIVVLEDGDYKIEYRVASPNSDTMLSADLNAGSVQLGKLTIPNTGGWQDWTTISHTVSLNSGMYDFGIYAQKGGWNINWFKITRIENLSLEDKIAKSSSFSIYPNPANKIVTIDGVDLSNLVLIDVQGKEYDCVELNKRQIDLSDLSNGIYFLKDKLSGISKKLIKVE